MVQKYSDGAEDYAREPHSDNQELLWALLHGQTRRLLNFSACKNSKASGRKGWQEKASAE